MYLGIFIGKTPVEEGTEENMGILVIIVVVLLLVLAIYLSYDYFETKKWKRGIFPSKLKYTKENLGKAYICLSASIIRRNLSESIPKSDFMYAYMLKEFSEDREKVKNAFNFSIKYPIQINTVCDWLNEYLKDDLNRLQIIYFLASQTMVEGELLQNEYRFLQYLTSMLHLEQKDLESIIATLYKQNKKHKSTKSNGKKTRSKSDERTPSKTKVNGYYKILGVTELSTLKEIKKAYRKLVMLHHPDKYATSSEEQLKKAQDRFLKIQEAYEYLEKKLG